MVRFAARAEQMAPQPLAASPGNVRRAMHYLDRTDVARLSARVRDSLAPGGDCLLVHWTGETEYPLSGDEAAERFIAAASDFAAVTRQERSERYRLDLLRVVGEARTPP